MNPPNPATAPEVSAPHELREIETLPVLKGLRELSAFGKEPLSGLEAFARYELPAFRIRGIDLRFVLIKDPELIGHLLLNRDEAFIKDRFIRDLKMVLGDGLLTSEGELWKRQRRTISPSLAPKQISAYADSMVKRSRRYAEGILQNSSTDVHAGLMQLTLDVVVETLFGAELDDRDEGVGELIEQLMEDYVLWMRSWRRLVPKWIPQPVVRRIRDVGTSIDEILNRIVAASERSIAEDRAGDDLLTRLLMARDDDGRAMPRHLLRDELMTMFTAGHETTALALAYALHALAEHPEYQDRLRAEVENVAAGREPGAQDMAALPFCTAVVRETLRLYPPVWITGREALRETRLGDYKVRRGDLCAFSPYTLHRDPKYFDAPLEFRPERWLDGLFDRLPRYAYLPFGGGQRVCVGMHFAMMEAVLILGTIVRNVRFSKLKDAPELKFFPAITLRPAGPLVLGVDVPE